NNTFFASSLGELNDPFEGLSNLEQAEASFKILSTGRPDYLEAAFQRVNERYNKVGIYSLSTDPENEILWALYADSHKGFVIGYDEDTLISTLKADAQVYFEDKVIVTYEKEPQNMMTWQGK